MQALAWPRERFGRTIGEGGISPFHLGYSWPCSRSYHFSPVRGGRCAIQGIGIDAGGLGVLSIV